MYMRIMLISEKIIVPFPENYGHVINKIQREWDFEENIYVKETSIQSRR